ncbi:fructose-1,6-bisphosphatase [Natrinema pellirubrum DSM 15624]|uniref:Fructose-1,6-bisphosphatase class 1 n=1 Tax=Natrinema pellirubrum (strain DSM 15624 / CIP 106293 / JCM 10476 / NCIMB 786 / 157) TaxID=797303 RepID=L0JP80_NATP1|nr:fructose-bisphosphatase class I [Natrinema pellirubrum]AGB32663.1 fructose-1,6-bisphosphatase [Natrinema pellirubrum DSM 15624]ELY73797.1 fructose-1,6-bisphosphatase [Natrinema pellirubrum DSM 15624]
MTVSDPVVEDIVATISRSATEIRQGLIGRRGTVDEENPSGETQAKADVWADELLGERLAGIDGVGQYASEERADVVDCGVDPADGDAYAVAVDPLDGSSNLKSNNTMGTIFGVYDAALPARGETLVAAGFVLYGPITTMVIATEETVAEYELSGGERNVVDDDVTLPDEPVVYGFGGRVPDWPADFREYAREIEDELKLRYGGALIGDVNQVLTYGGTFGYPGLESRPEGKLRLQFEGNPIGYVVERAGGRSSNGDRSLLAVEPDALHDRTPVHVGNDELIERLEAALA